MASKPYSRRRARELRASEAKAEASALDGLGGCPSEHYFTAWENITDMLVLHMNRGRHYLIPGPGTPGRPYYIYSGSQAYETRRAKTASKHVGFSVRYNIE